MKLQITKTQWSATKEYLYLGFISSGELTEIILQKTLSLEEESLEEENKQIDIALGCPDNQMEHWAHWVASQSMFVF